MASVFSVLQRFQHIGHIGAVVGIAGEQGGIAAGHQVGMSCEIQHGTVVEVIAKGHDISAVNAEDFTELLQTETLAGAGEVQPRDAGNGNVEGFFPAGGHLLFIDGGALTAVGADLDDILGNILGTIDNGVVVPHKIGEIAQQLKIGRDVPVLYRKRRVVDEYGSLVELAYAYYRADRFVYQIDLPWEED